MRSFASGKFFRAHERSSEVWDAPVSTSIFAGTPLTFTSTRNIRSPGSGTGTPKAKAVFFGRKSSVKFGVPAAAETSGAAVAKSAGRQKSKARMRVFMGKK